MRSTMNAAAEPSGGSRVDRVIVATDDAGTRLDRWFRRRFPDITHGCLEKWLRTGQVRVDGRRARASTRLVGGETIRVPPQADVASVRRQPVAPATDDAAARLLADAILYEDHHLVVINKPAGLAVQGGSGTRRHLDGMLDVLGVGGERPRLVHRLDKDTAGVLVIARSRSAATALSALFQGRHVRKLYWALVAGVPSPSAGRVSVPLAKRLGAGGERMRADARAGDPAITSYRVLDAVGGFAAWLALEPLTGRTHQLRVHCATLGTPIVGDGKYGGRGAFLEQAGCAAGLHLLARAIAFPHPAGGSRVAVAAPLPRHMQASWRALNLPVPSPAQTLRDWDGTADGG